MTQQLETSIAVVRDMFMNIARDHIGRDQNPGPRVGILCTTDPRNGRPYGNPGLVILVPTTLDTDDEKDQFALVARVLATAGAASASVLCMDAWILEGADAIRSGVPPSKHKQRREALFVCVERRTADGTLSVYRYSRKGKVIEFEEPQVRNFSSDDEVSGRFVEVLPRGIVTSDARARARALVATGAFGTLDIQEITQ